jgi:hypothetical protein
VDKSLHDGNKSPEGGIFFSQRGKGSKDRKGVASSENALRPLPLCEKKKVE